MHNMWQPNTHDIILKKNLSRDFIQRTIAGSFRVSLLTDLGCP